MSLGSMQVQLHAEVPWQPGCLGFVQIDCPGNWPRQQISALVVAGLLMTCQMGRHTQMLKLAVLQTVQ